MLWRKLLMTGVSGPALTSCWVIPGGRMFAQNAQGDLVMLDPEDGWPEPSDAGDPFVDAERLVGSYVHRNLGGGFGEAVSVRFDRDLAEQQQRSLGPYRGWAGENVAVGISSLGYGLGGTAHTFPSFALSGGDGSHDTGPTAGWPWEQQDSGNAVSGQPTISPFIQTIQNDYIAGMAYDWGACAARDLAVVLKLVATTYSSEPDVDPSGRRYLGWTMDSGGIVRRIVDMTPAQARQLGHDNGFRPDAGEIVTAKDQSHSWAFLRPLGPVGDGAIAAVGVFQYSETYDRLPTPQERPWFTAGHVGYESRSAPLALLDQPMEWLTGPLDRPLVIQETRSSFVFCTLLIDRFGIVGTPTVTGRTSSRSTRLFVRQGSAFGPYVNFRIFRRIGGGYDVFWAGHPEYARRNYLGTTFDTEFDTSPNGWRIAVNRPFITDAQGNPQPVPGYATLLQWPDVPTGNAQPPGRPSGWNDATQGPWTPPPNDIDYSRYWRGFRFRNVDTGALSYQQSPNSTYSDGSRFGDLNGTVQLDGTRPAHVAPRNAAERFYGEGTFLVAQHEGASGYATHEAGHIVPGVTGPGGTYQPFAEADGLDPAMRLFRWPGRSWAIALFQKGGWVRSANGGATWSPMIDLGPVLGSRSVGGRFEKPEPPEPPEV